MPWRPLDEHDRYPTLGYYAIDWMTKMLAAPDKADYEPFVPYVEQEDFLLQWYRIDPVTGKWKHTRGLLGRPRGFGKSPLLAGIAALEALAPVVPAGWDADGQPVGRPWSSIRTPLVQIAAVSEEQTRNSWSPLVEMLRGGPVMDEYPGLEPMDSFVALPTGAIRKVASSARTIKGATPVFSCLDQTEEWVPSNGGIKLANVMRANAAKVGGRTLESPNAYVPGEGSVAEQSAAFAQAILEGRAKDESLLYDHREAPASTDLADRESLIAGLRVAYGDSSGHPGGCVIHDPPCPPGHVDLDRLVSTIWDPAQDVQVSRSDFLNQITHASDQWVTREQWQDRLDPRDPITPGEVVVLGFDGSMGRERGRADATALVGCRVRDGRLFQVLVLESPPPPAGRDWAPDPAEVDWHVRDCFARYRVVGLYADPTGWTEPITRWEAEFRRKLRVRASAAHPMMMWPRGKATDAVSAVERFRQAVCSGELTHDGAPALTRHVLNARKRSVPQGYLIYKQHPASLEKIDAAYAGVMAWKARLDAVAAGLAGARERRMAVTL